MRKAKVTKMYKDRLFRLVFREKADLLELYNAVNQSQYTDPDQLEITTIEDAVYIGMKNDISFLIDDILNLYEHQSTYNPNMPARGFFYFADVYRKYVESRKLNLLGSKLAALPFPQYVVFYNGLQEEPDIQELKLSDAFRKGKPGTERFPCLELKVTMVNINLGHNRELMGRCQKLKEYAQFVSLVREILAEGEPLEHAIDEAVDHCIADGILADILSSNRAEVCDVILTEYDEQSHIASERAESWEEGKAEGKAEERAICILELLSEKGSVPQHLRDQIMKQEDLEVLHSWFKLAIQASGIQDFEQMIK